MDEPDTDEGAHEPEDSGQEGERLSCPPTTTVALEGYLIPIEGTACTTARVTSAPLDEDTERREPCN